MKSNTQQFDEIEKKLEQAQEMLKKLKKDFKKIKKNSCCDSSPELSYFNLQRYMRKHYV
jgi:predicted translin family RNA/ssDNA-binding protein